MLAAYVGLAITAAVRGRPVTSKIRKKLWWLPNKCHYLEEAGMREKRPCAR